VTDASGDPIGLTGLWQVNWHDHNAEVAIKLGGTATVRGRGLGSDTLKAVMAFAFYEVGLHRLYATILSSNTASIKLFVNHAGFQHEGRGSNTKGWPVSRSGAMAATSTCCTWGHCARTSMPCRTPPNTSPASPRPRMG
jgi:RimJ/RimL family protein N-acetyltransferase